MPEPYGSHDWALVPAKPGLQGWILMKGEYIYIYIYIYSQFINIQPWRPGLAGTRAQSYIYIYIYIYMASLNHNSSLIFPLSLHVTPLPISTIIPCNVAVSCFSCSCYWMMHKLQCAFPSPFTIYGVVAWRSSTDFRSSLWTVAIVTTLRNIRSEARIPAGATIFIFFKWSRTALEPTQHRV